MTKGEEPAGQDESGVGAYSPIGRPSVSTPTIANHLRLRVKVSVSTIVNLLARASMIDAYHLAERLKKAECQCHIYACSICM